MNFLKTCRTELDRLIEQSPTIPDSVISECRREFSKYPAVRKPEIVGDIKTTPVFVDTDSRAKKLAQEAALTLAQKKGVLKQIVLDDLEPRIQRVLEYSTLPAIREDLRDEARQAAATAAREVATTGRTASAAGTGIGVAASTGGPPRTEPRAERNEEVQRLAMSGVVRAMREKLAVANEKTGRVPSGIGALFADVPTAATILAGASSRITDTIRHVTDDDDDDDDDESEPGSKGKVTEGEAVSINMSIGPEEKKKL